MKSLKKLYKKILCPRIVLPSLACMLLYCIVPSAINANPGNGKALGHTQPNGNPFNNAILDPIGLPINPAGIIPGTGGMNINQLTMTENLAPGQAKNITMPNIAEVFVTAGQFASTAIVIENLNIVNKNMMPANKLLLAAGDQFSMAVIDINTAASSLTVPMAVGSKADPNPDPNPDPGPGPNPNPGPNPGPNPVHGTQHPNKSGNPGGGNGNGNWDQGNQGSGYGNVWTGNQGKGVGQGMAAGPNPGPNPNPNPGPNPNPNPNPNPDPDPDPDPPEPDPDPDPEPEPIVLPDAPLPQYQVPTIEGCPVEMQAAAAELGLTRDSFQLAIGNSLALNPSIQPCDACAELLDAANILTDLDGSRTQALINAFNSLAPMDAPFTTEMAISIYSAFEDIEQKTQFASATEYIDAFVRYVAVLDNQLGSPVGDSVVFVMEKYGAAIVNNENPNISDFIVARLEVMETFAE